MSDPAASVAGSSDTPDSRLVRAARTLATLARRISRGVAALSVASAVAGGTLWGLLWWPPPSGLGPLLGAAATGALFLGPAAVLGLFFVGLRDLLSLPARLSERGGRTVKQSADVLRSVTTDPRAGLLGRLWSILKQIWALRSVLQENRALLVRYGALIRFVNPGFLLLVVLSTGLSLLLVPLAAVAGLAAVL
ncbi:MAG: hypothetical protein ABEL97_05670 [Salinibacter sp.]